MVLMVQMALMATKEKLAKRETKEKLAKMAWMESMGCPL
jgi:hypothetical protein